MNGPPADTDGTRAEREEQILQAAERQFAEAGFYAVSMDAIADEVGLSKQMVYNYVGSKESLYVACFRRARVQLLGLLAGAAAGQTPGEQLLLGVNAFFKFVEEHREPWALIHEHASQRGGPFAAEVNDMRTEIGRLISQLFVDAREAVGNDPSSVNTEVTAYAVLGAMESMAHWWKDHPEVPREELTREMVAVVWTGLERAVR
ncbi:MAG: TetR/AcrR family transcriptional regulator [Thermoleophilaceae bacterium]